MKTTDQLKKELNEIWEKWYSCKDEKECDRLYKQMDEVKEQIRTRDFINAHATDPAGAWDNEVVIRHKEKVSQINELIWQLDTRVRNAKYYHQKSIIITFSEVEQIINLIQQLM